MHLRVVPLLRRGVWLAACAIVLAWPGRVDAQTSTPSPVTLVYGISAGPGRRTTTGTFLPAALPAHASPLDGGRNGGLLTLEAGAEVRRRIAFMAEWDQTIAANSGEGRWGMTTLVGTARVRVMPRIWIEGGGGAAQLGYRPPRDAAAGVSRFWAPARAVAAGVDVLQGPRVSVTACARYSTATFHGQTVTTLSFQVGLAGR